MGDNGDRYRTAALKLQLGPIDVGFNLFTGDPGLDERNVDYTQGGKGGQYMVGQGGEDPDEFRFGVGYIGIGPLRFGNDKESRRHNIQNVLIHDKVTPLAQALA